MEARLSIVGVGLPVAVESTTARTDAATETFIVNLLAMSLILSKIVFGLLSRHEAWTSAALCSCRRRMILVTYLPPVFYRATRSTQQRDGIRGE